MSIRWDIKRYISVEENQYLLVLKDYLFIGGFFPESSLKVFKSKSIGSFQSAANNFQWAFINGIERNIGRSITLVTSPFLGYFPTHYKDLLVATNFFTHGENQNGLCVGFINLPLVKNMFKYLNLIKYLNSLVSFEKGNDTTVFVYSMNLPYVLAGVWLKKMKKVNHISLIVTDLPQFPGDCNFLYKIYLRVVEKRWVSHCLSKFDSFVVLTDKMIDFLGVDSKKWIRIEGLYDDTFTFDLPKRYEARIILYSGSLDLRYGIKSLIDAFTMIESNDIFLWICGGGEEGLNLVINASRKDSRIKYLGILDKGETLYLQSSVTLLVNPRNTVGDYNYYSFPSKTMEYFASGTATLMYKLQGVPEEYFHYCFTIDGNDLETLAHAMVNCVNLPPHELVEIGNAARNFILTKKNSMVQCKKVLDMVEGKSIREDSKI